MGTRGREIVGMDIEKLLKLLNQQEVEHEEDLQSIREDLDLMVQRGLR
jgi:hypothetical protein